MVYCTSSPKEASSTSKEVGNYKGNIFLNTLWIGYSTLMIQDDPWMGFFLYFFVFRYAIHVMQPQKNPYIGIRATLKSSKDDLCRRSILISTPKVFQPSKRFFKGLIL